MCRCVAVLMLVCWCVGVLMCRCVGVLICWYVDALIIVLILICVDNIALMSWCINNIMLMCWRIDVLICWCVSVLAFVCLFTEPFSSIFPICVPNHASSIFPTVYRAISSVCTVHHLSFLSAYRATFYLSFVSAYRTMCWCIEMLFVSTILHSEKNSWKYSGLIWIFEDFYSIYGSIWPATPFRNVIASSGFDERCALEKGRTQISTERIIRNKCCRQPEYDLCNGFQILCRKLRKCRNQHHDTYCSCVVDIRLPPSPTPTPLPLVACLREMTTGEMWKKSHRFYRNHTNDVLTGWSFHLSFQFWLGLQFSNIFSNLFCEKSHLKISLELEHGSNFVIRS
jgi:hypothetical protein